MMRTILILVCILNISLAQAAVGFMETLKSAATTNESIKIAKSKSDQVEQKINQSDANFLPKLNLIGSYTRLGLPENSKNPSLENNAHSLRFNAIHPLFRGFKDMATLKSAQYDKLSQVELEQYARYQLYSTVAQTFFSIIALEDDQKNLSEQLKLLNNRIKELKERVGLGKSRKADLLTAQSQMASTRAQIEYTNAQLEVTRESFGNLTGLSPQVPLEVTAQDFPAPEELQHYLSRIEFRPDIKSIRRQIESTIELNKAAKGSRLPSLDLAGNYYLDRSGRPKPSAWDVGLSLTLPLYEGGVISSQVQEILEKQNEKSLYLDQARKNAEKEIKIYYETLLANQKQIEALNESIKSSFAAYQEHMKDYRFGMSSLLDVLQAENNYLDSKKSYDRLKAQTHLAWVQLQLASAEEKFN